MQDLLLEDSSTMTEQRIDLNMLSRIDSEQKATASRVESLGKSVQDLAQEVSGIKGTIKPPTDTPWWLRFIIAPVCVAAIVATAGAVIHLEIVVGGIETFIHNNAQSIGELQRIQTQTTLDQAEQDAKAGNKIAAKQQVVQATELLEKLTSSSVSAPLSFFKRSADKLDRLSSVVDYSDTHQAFVRLADYRSALQVAHDLPGAILNCAAGSKLKSLIGIAGDKSNANHFVTGGTITNCPQTLDAITWKNVVFLNDRISYNGGPVVLDNVRFIHCTFETIQTDDGVRVLQYAALDENSLKVKPEFFEKPLATGL